MTKTMATLAVGIFAAANLQAAPLPGFVLAGQTQLAHSGGSEELTITAGGGDVVLIANTGPVWPYQLYAAADIKVPADALRQALEGG